MDTRLPYFEGQKDCMAFMRFIDNRKEYDRYMKALDTKVAAFFEAVKVYGKAKEIEGKHEEAELWLAKCQGDFAKREAALLAGESALVKELREHRAKMKNREVDLEQAAATTGRDQTVREVALSAREAGLEKREQAITGIEQAAEKRSQAAVEAKRAAEDLVKRVTEAAGS